jgi:hypothetical protein
LPGLFLVISIGSGLEEIIDQNLNAPSVIDFNNFTINIYSPDCFFGFINDYDIF